MHRPFFSIINHGPEHSQYFQGQGTSYTPYDNVVTGIGDTAHEAYTDCVEQVYQWFGSKAEQLKLPKHPRGIRQSDRLSKEEMENEEYHWFVSIVFTIND